MMGRGSSKAGGGGGGATVDKSREFTETKTKTGMQKLLDEASTGSSFNIMLDDGSRLEYKKRDDGQWDVKNIAVDNSLNNERTSPSNVVAARAFRDKADITKANIKAQEVKGTKVLQQGQQLKQTQKSLTLAKGQATRAQQAFQRVQSSISNFDWNQKNAFSKMNKLISKRDTARKKVDIANKKRDKLQKQYTKLAQAASKRQTRVLAQLRKNGGPLF